MLLSVRRLSLREAGCTKAGSEVGRPGMKPVFPELSGGRAVLRVGGAEGAEGGDRALRTLSGLSPQGGRQPWARAFPHA